MSDLHGMLPEIEESFDIMLLAGDLVDLYKQSSKDATIEWYSKDFVDWINGLPFNDKNSKVIWIAGNHEVAFYDLGNMLRLSFAKEIEDLTNGRAIYLEDSYAIINGIKIYGTPWCKVFGYWAFMRSNDVLVQYYDKIPEGVDILLTHDAPYGTSDMCYGWYKKPEHIGNIPLRDAIIKKKPKLCLHGHLHSSNHDEEKLEDTIVRNVSLVDEAYDITYPPLVFYYKID